MYDVNGDGKADVCGRASAGIYCALGNGDGTFGPLTLWATYFSDAAGWDLSQYGTTIEFGRIDSYGNIDAFGRSASGVVFESLPLWGYINPKYAIVGVTYAPPGSASSVTYDTSLLMGSTITIAKTFTNQNGVSTGVNGTNTFTIADPDVPGISALIGFGDSISSSQINLQQAGNSSSVTLSKSTSSGITSKGPANSFAGLDPLRPR